MAKKRRRTNNTSPSLLETSILQVVKSDNWPSAAGVRAKVKPVNSRFPNITTVTMMLKRLVDRDLIRSERRPKDGLMRYRYKMTRAGSAEFRRTQSAMRRLMK